MTGTEYIAEADKLSQLRQASQDEADRAEFVQREYELLCKAAENTRENPKLLMLRLRISRLPGLDINRRIEAMIHAATCAERSGDLEQARQLAESALELSITHGDKHGRINALSELGVQWRYAGDLKRSASLLHEACDHADELNDKRLIARTSSNYANTLRKQHQFDEAEQHLGKAARLYRALGDLGGAVRSLVATAGMQHEQGLDDHAVITIQEACELAEMVPDPGQRGRATGNLGLLLLEIGRIEDAIAQLNNSRDHFLEAGMEKDALRATFVAAPPMLDLNQASDAIQRLEASISVARDKQFARELAEALSHAGAAYCHLGEWEKACSSAKESAEMLKQTDKPLPRHANALTFGRCAMHNERFEDALEFFREGEQLANDANSPELQGTALRLQGEALEALERLDEAREAELQSLECLESTDGGHSPEYLKTLTVSARIEFRAGNTEDARALALDAQALWDELELSSESGNAELARTRQTLDELAS